MTLYFPTCVTESDYLINVAGLKGHTLAVHDGHGEESPGFADDRARLVRGEQDAHLDCGQFVAAAWARPRPGKKWVPSNT